MASDADFDADWHPGFELCNSLMPTGLQTMKDVLNGGLEILV